VLWLGVHRKKLKITAIIVAATGRVYALFGGIWSWRLAMPKKLAASGLGERHEIKQFCCCPSLPQSVSRLLQQEKIKQLHVTSSQR